MRTSDLADKPDHRSVLYDSYVSTFKDRSYASGHGVETNGSALLRWLPEDPDSCVVEVGCGRGTLLAWIRAHGYNNTLGIDISAEQVAAATNDAGPVECRDALDMIRAGSLTAHTVIAMDVLEHLTKEEAIDFVKGSRAAGVTTLIFQLPNAAAPRGMHFQAGDLTHQTLYSPSSLRQLCRLGGYEDVVVSEVAPEPRGRRGVLRYLGWKLLRSAYQVRETIETGGPSEALTRNMLVRATAAAPCSSSSGSWSTTSDLSTS